MVRIGYACINTKLPGSNRTCRLKNATPERVLELASANLSALQSILEWNVAHGIELFRISSDVIPFGSHPINKVHWRRILQPQFTRLRAFIAEKRLRVSMHPGQYTVLNSPRREVVESSIKDLEYHASLLEALGADASHKIIIHLGGIYGDKKASLKRFVAGCRDLDQRIRSRLAIENDERCYTIADALSASESIGVAVVFDVFHHSWNPALEQHSLRGIIERAAKSWRRSDGRVKIHYSNQWPGQAAGTHSKSISLQKFLEFYESVEDLDLDIMLEVKDKQESVLKIQKALRQRRRSAA